MQATFHRCRHTWAALLVGALAGVTAAADDLAWLDHYNVVWTTPSRNSGESMPGGGGSIGLNVWVENGDVLAYVSRPDAFEENGGLLKSGRLRVRLTPNVFDEGEAFRQELKLREGAIEIEGRKGGQTATVHFWCEIHRPVVHVEVRTKEPGKVEAFYENWRMSPFQLNDVNWNKTPANKRPASVPDVVSVRDGAVEFFHRNPETGLFDLLVRAYRLEPFKDQLWNPQRNRTSGGILRARGLSVDTTPVKGVYARVGFQGWRLSGEQIRDASLEMVLHTAQTDTIDQWREQLAAVDKAAPTDAKADATRWWSDFWNRSRIVIGDKPEPDAAAWQVGRNYQLARFMFACNAYGALPTKFNGGLHIFEPSFALPVGMEEANWVTWPDNRGWGGTNFTSQNQRLLYWPMLKSGDTDMMAPQLNFFPNMRRNGEFYTKAMWGIENAASFKDQTNYFGIPYGAGPDLSNPPATTEELIQSLGHNLFYYHNSQNEWSFMMLEWARYSGGDIKPFLPFIESSLRFFDEFYQMHQRRRDGEPYGPDGKLVFEPAQSLETYKDSRNPLDLVTGTKVVLDRIVQLPDDVLPAERKAVWKEMLQRLPQPVHIADFNGKRVLLPAEKYGNRTNGEIPQLYVLFPYNTWGIGRPDLQVAIDSWRDGGPNMYNDKGWWSWYQNGIFTARLGLVDEARYYAIAKLGDSGRKFPAIFGPGFDATPDMNHAGSGMIGLQDMLLQEAGDDLFLLPAWPADWTGSFKLHAGWKTVVEGTARNGALASLSLRTDGARQLVRLHAPGIGSAKVSQDQAPVATKSPDDNTLEFPVAAGNTYTLSGLSVPEAGPAKVAVEIRSDNFDTLKGWVNVDKTTAEVVIEEPSVAGATGKALKVAPGSVVSLDLGRRVRGVLRVRAYAPSPEAGGTVEILNGNETDQRFVRTAASSAEGKPIYFGNAYAGVMAGRAQGAAWEMFTPDLWVQFMQQKPKWRPIGAGLPVAAGWVEITLDASREGYVTIGVKDLSSGKVEQSRVRTIDLIRGFRYVRIGNYGSADEPMWFDDLKVRADQS